MPRLITDIVERTIATYAATFLGLLLADGFDITSLGALKAASIAALPAALSVVKGALGPLVGDSSTAGWLPRSGG
ncbi:holin [Streptomyces sp. NPDC005180]|uniref:holin n=1 Tax=Streptomyces sp. NPDC005180 TaxID=3156868 RepID=UPI0033BC8F73